MAKKSLERRFRDGLIRRKPDRSFREIEPGKQIARSIDRLRTERKDAQVVLAHADAQQRPLSVLERGHPVARRLLRIRHCSPNKLTIRPTPAFCGSGMVARYSSNEDIVISLLRCACSRAGRHSAKTTAPTRNHRSVWSPKTAHFATLHRRVTARWVGSRALWPLLRSWRLVEFLSARSRRSTRWPRVVRPRWRCRGRSSSTRRSRRQ